MNQMKKLVLKAASLVAAVGITLIVFFCVPGTYDYPLAAIVNKMDTLRAAGSPKMVVVGGSEVLVGVDSGMLMREFNYPVVNMGLYVGFGLGDVLPLIVPFLGKGDVVIIIPEYFAMQQGMISDQFTHKWYFLLSPEYAMKKVYCPQNKLASLPGDISDLLLVKISGMLQMILKRQNMFANGMLNYPLISNAHGDLLENWPNVPKEKLSGAGNKLLDKPIKDSVFKVFNGFNDAAVKAKARVFMAYTSYPDGEYLLNRSEVDYIERQFHERLHFVILGVPADSVFPYECFSNTVNHLRFEGRTLRTKRMIELLKKEGIVPLKKNR